MQPNYGSGDTVSNWLLPGDKTTESCSDGARSPFRLRERTPMERAAYSAERPQCYSKILPRLKRQTLNVFTTAAMPNKTASVGSNSRVVQFVQSTCTNPSIAQ
jgi:hypothetical protein